ncbi:DUF2087 domain-containing protein [Micromonospora sp. NPDC049903]|uniref:DUF2087 domain-containing protein n=1 Tax=Micromonospora sp. NPDC049903 TaxID=3364276 RepID=UPI0037AF7300
MSAEAAHAAEILAALAAPERLRALAELARRGEDGLTVNQLAQALDIPVSKAGAALARLHAIGVVTGTGVYRARLDALRETAADLDRQQPISRLLVIYPELRSVFSHGRLTTLPPTLSRRWELLAEMLVRFLDLDGPCDEDEINRRLAAVTDDVAGARRMLVDAGWLERDRAGTTYGTSRTVPARESSA